MAKLLVWLIELIVAFFRPSKDQEVGQLKEREAQANEAMEDISKANAVRDHYNRDPAFRERVSERFKRKE